MYILISETNKRLDHRFNIEFQTLTILFSSSFVFGSITKILHASYHHTAVNSLGCDR